MPNPTIPLSVAIATAVTCIDELKAGGLNERSRTKLKDAIAISLTEQATVAARDEQGRFIGDNPSTAEDESRSPVFGNGEPEFNPEDAPPQPAPEPTPEPENPEPAPEPEPDPDPEEGSEEEE